MNSYQFCQTQEWKDYRDRKWRELYNMENDSNWMDTEEWIAAGCPPLPHPKWSGNYIKCAYCGWYHDISDDRHFVLEHVLPVHAYPDKRLDDNNIVLACNVCNEHKGGKILCNTLADVIIDYQKDVLSGNCAGDSQNLREYQQYMERQKECYSY